MAKRLCAAHTLSRLDQRSFFAPADRRGFVCFGDGRGRSLRSCLTLRREAWPRIARLTVNLSVVSIRIRSVLVRVCIIAMLVRSRVGGFVRPRRFRLRLLKRLQRLLPLLGFVDVTLYQTVRPLPRRAVRPHFRQVLSPRPSPLGLGVRALPRILPRRLFTSPFGRGRPEGAGEGGR